MTQSFTKFYTEMHGVFLEKDCVERVAQRRFTRMSFKFQVSSFGVVTQSFTKFYTEFHGVFFEVDCVERDAQRGVLFCFFATD